MTEASPPNGPSCWRSFRGDALALGSAAGRGDDSGDGGADAGAGGASVVDERPAAVTPGATPEGGGG